MEDKSTKPASDKKLARADVNSADTLGDDELNKVAGGLFDNNIGRTTFDNAIGRKAGG